MVVMVLLITAVAGTAVGVAAFQPKSPAAAAAKPKTDKDNLQGTWIPVSAEEAGTKVPKEKIKDRNFEMVISGDKITLPIKDESKEVRFKLDPSKKPKHIDLLMGKDKTAKGIYLLKGDTLKLCVEKEPDSDRPTKFSTEGTTHVLIVLKRKK
jgi:uncharacterized protein (TIGR03067 family)